MPEKKFHEMDRVDRAIADFATIKKPTIGDLNKVRVIARLEKRLDKYRTRGESMTDKELLEEKHRSRRLARHMTASGDPRPHELCDAHAIISGAHKDAAALRAVLAWFQRRIDDPINGCWLPRNTEAISYMPSWLREAVPHSRIHRASYYEWLGNTINLDLIETDQQLVEALRHVEHRLQTCALPDHILEQIH